MYYVEQTEGKMFLYDMDVKFQILETWFTLFWYVSYEQFSPYSHSKILPKQMALSP